MTPELQMLLTCLSPGPAADTAKICRLAGAGLDWATLIRLAQLHHVVPLLRSSLHLAGEGLASPDAIRRLADVHAACAARTLYLAHETLRHLDLYRREGIRVFPFKGAALAAMAFGDVTLRQYDDIDLLVHPADLARAVRLSQAQGFRSHLPLSGPELEAYLDAGWDYNYNDPHTDYWVELDSSIGPSYFSYQIDPREFWDHPVHVSIEGHQVQTVEPPFLFALLCLHGTGHAWERLQWLADVAALIRSQPGMDWDRARDFAVRSRGWRALLLGCFLASEFTGASIPATWRDAAANDRELGRLAARLADRWGHADALRPSARESRQFHLHTKDNLGDRLRYLARLATTPSYSDWKAIPLPRRLFFLYWLIRPFRLLGSLMARRRPPTQ